MTGQQFYPVFKIVKSRSSKTKRDSSDQGYSNVFGIYANNSLVLGLSTNGVLVNGNLQASGLSLGGNESISSDGNGGIQLNSGNGNADLTINNLTLNGDTIQFPAQSGGNLKVGTNGDFVFDNNVRITSLGNITLPVPGGSVAISANSQGINVAGINISATNGIILPASDRNRSITATTSGIIIDGISLNQNTIILPNDHGSPTTISTFSQGLNINSSVYGTSFVTTSDRNVKEQFKPVDSREVLERVASLPITSWNFKQDANTRHIGPMAQDFYSAFNVGTDDKHIATVDEDGVALAAIQGLNEKLKEKDAEIAALAKRLADLETLLKSSLQTK